MIRELVANAIYPKSNIDRFLGINFREYFKDFCAVHGEPVQSGGRLLFADGYSYASLDHRGPEYPPPSDPEKLLTIKITYWRARLALVRKLLAFHAQRLRRLEGLSAAQEQAGETRERLAWLLSDADQSEAELKNLDAI